MKAAIMILIAVIFNAFGPAYAGEDFTYQSVLAEPATLEGMSITQKTTFAELLPLIDQYNDKVPAQHPSYLNFPEMGAMVAVDEKCNLVFSQEDMIVWVKLSLNHPDVDNTKFIGKARCMADGNSVTTPVAMAEMQRQMLMPSVLVDGDGKQTLEPPLATPEQLKGVRGVQIGDTQVVAFDFAKECTGYTGKFWAWRRDKCMTAQPGWTAPAEGHTLTE